MGYPLNLPLAVLLAVALPWGLYAFAMGWPLRRGSRFLKWFRQARRTLGAQASQATIEHWRRFLTTQGIPAGEPGSNPDAIVELIRSAMRQRASMWLSYAGGALLATVVLAVAEFALLSPLLLAPSSPTPEQAVARLFLSWLIIAPVSSACEATAGLLGARSARARLPVETSLSAPAGDRSSTRLSDYRHPLLGLLSSALIGVAILLTILATLGALPPFGQPPFAEYITQIPSGDLIVLPGLALLAYLALEADSWLTALALPRMFT